MHDRHVALYRTVWRWHFYAGLFVIPFILVLAVSGSIYLFKPQIERWEERAYQGMPVEGAVSADVQLKAVLDALSGANFLSYRLPQKNGDATAITVALPGIASTESRQVFVSPQGRVLGSLDPEARLTAIVARLHGQLLLGPTGSWLVELAACWAIVMLLTGLYLWWPRERRLAGVLWPRLGSGGRAFWRDLHAVTGFWVSMFALILLVTGLPWAAVWGSAFRAVRTEMGWMNGPQSWSIGGRVSTSEQHGSPAGNAPHIGTSLAKALPVMVEKAAHETLDFPVLVIPPGAPQRFASPVAAWTIKSETQIRPRQTTILFDPVSLEQVSRENFSDRHPIDRAVGYGVAWHEGQLFGWPNQLIGLITATCLIVLAMT
ncbi:MAG: PepSY-associated TM helix domain-containing protein, partial [Hyphomicrobiaceae bacterium]